jgi:hypothetical protein
MMKIELKMDIVCKKYYILKFVIKIQNNYTWTALNRVWVMQGSRVELS